MVNGVMNAFDTSTLAVTSVYFLFVSRDWLYLYLALAVLATICQITLLIVDPESPKWLLIKGKYFGTPKNCVAQFSTKLII